MNDEDINQKNENEESDDLKRRSPGIGSNEYIQDANDQNDMEIDSDDQKSESSYSGFRASSQQNFVIHPTNIGEILTNPELEDGLFSDIIKNYREYEAEKEKNITIIVQAEKVMKKQITKYGSDNTASDNSQNFENFIDGNQNKYIEKLGEIYNMNRNYIPLIKEIEDDIKYPIQNENFDVNYMNDLWDKAKKNHNTYNQAMNIFGNEYIKKEDEENKKNYNMIQLGIEDDEISLQNTINQAKIGSFDDMSFKIDFYTDEDKFYIMKNREIYNKSKRFYRIIIESEGQVIEDFIELNPKSIQRIIQLMGNSSPSEVNYFDLMSLIDEKQKYIFNRAYDTKQKVSDQDEYTQNHIFNQRKCLENPNAKYIISGFEKNNDLEIPISSNSMKKISKMINIEPEYVSLLDTIGFSIVYVETEKKSYSSLGSNDRKNSKSAEILIRNKNDKKNDYIEENQEPEYNFNNIRRGIYTFKFNNNEPIRIIEKSSNKIRELMDDEECLLDQINYTKMPIEDEFQLRRKKIIPERRNKIINFDSLSDNQQYNVNIMGKIMSIPSVIYLVSGIEFLSPKKIVLNSSSFNKIYHLIPRKKNEIIVLDLIPIMLYYNDEKERKLITNKKNPIGKYTSISQIEEVEDEDESIDKKSLISTGKKKSEEVLNKSENINNDIKKSINKDFENNKKNSLNIIKDDNNIKIKDNNLNDDDMLIDDDNTINLKGETILENPNNNNTQKLTTLNEIIRQEYQPPPQGDNYKTIGKPQFSIKDKLKKEEEEMKKKIEKEKSFFPIFNLPTSGNKRLFDQIIPKKNDEDLIEKDKKENIVNPNNNQTSNIFNINNNQKTNNLFDTNNIFQNPNLNKNSFLLNNNNNNNNNEENNNIQNPIKTNIIEKNPFALNQENIEEIKNEKNNEIKEETEIKNNSTSIKWGFNNENKNENIKSDNKEIKWGFNNENKNNNIKSDNKVIKWGFNNENKNENIKSDNKVINWGFNNENKNENINSDNKVINWGFNNKNKNDNINSENKVINWGFNNKIKMKI